MCIRDRYISGDIEIIARVKTTADMNYWRIHARGQSNTDIRKAVSIFTACTTCGFTNRIHDYLDNVVLCDTGSANINWSLRYYRITYRAVGLEYSWYVDDTFMCSGVDGGAYQPTSGYVGVNAQDVNLRVDFFIVRKYVEPEPSVTVEYVSETVTYTDYFYWGMAKMLSGAIANLMQLPIKMEIYSGGNLIKTLSLKEISTITDAENKYIISVLKFEDDSSDSYQTDKQIIYVTDPNGNLRKLAESTYVFIKMAELPLLLGFEIRIPYEDTQVELS